MYPGNGQKSVHCSIAPLTPTLTFETDRKDLRELLLAIEWVKKDDSEREADDIPYQENILKSWGSMVQKGTKDKTNIVIEGKAFELAVLEHYAKEAELSKPISPHKLRHFLFTWLKKQGIDDALIQPYSGHESRQSLEIYSKLSITDAQSEYERVINKFPI